MNVQGQAPAQKGFPVWIAVVLSLTVVGCGFVYGKNLLSPAKPAHHHKHKLTRVQRDEKLIRVLQREVEHYRLTCGVKS